jgi:hypothetical protein
VLGHRSSSPGEGAIPDDIGSHELRFSRAGDRRYFRPAIIVASEARYLETAIDRYSPGVAATARAGLHKLRSQFPGARQLVFERRQSLPIGFAPADGGGPIFSLVLYQRWVRFFFLDGIALDDPEGRLEGDGNRVRSIRLDDQASILDEPYIRGLMAQALKVAGANLRAGAGEVVLKSTRVKASARPRAPGRRA